MGLERDVTSEECFVKENKERGFFQQEGECRDFRKEIENIQNDKSLSDDEKTIYISEKESEFEKEVTERLGYQYVRKLQRYMDNDYEIIKQNIKEDPSFSKTQKEMRLNEVRVQQEIYSNPLKYEIGTGNQSQFERVIRNLDKTPIGSSGRKLEEFPFFDESLSDLYDQLREEGYNIFLYPNLKGRTAYTLPNGVKTGSCGWVSHRTKEIVLDKDRRGSALRTIIHEIAGHKSFNNKLKTQPYSEDIPETITSYFDPDNQYFYLQGEVEDKNGFIEYEGDTKFFDEYNARRKENAFSRLIGNNRAIQADIDLNPEEAFSQLKSRGYPVSYLERK